VEHWQVPSWQVPEQQSKLVVQCADTALQHFPTEHASPEQQSLEDPHADPEGSHEQTPASHVDVPQHWLEAPQTVPGFAQQVPRLGLSSVEMAASVGIQLDPVQQSVG
jgi:hypothetical protein